MTRTSGVSAAAVDGLLDHATAQARSMEKLDNLCWYALEILTEADRIFSVYGLPPAPGDELRPLLESIRHFRLTAPVGGLHPMTPDGGPGDGEDPAPSSGTAPTFPPGVDVGEGT